MQHELPFNPRRRNRRLAPFRPMKDIDICKVLNRLVEKEVEYHDDKLEHKPQGEVEVRSGTQHRILKTDQTAMRRRRCSTHMHR